MSIKSPFPSSEELSTAGNGEVVLTVLSPNHPSIVKQSYKYPLKLISRTPHFTPESKYPLLATTPVHLYLLTYGGGLLPGDHINLSVTTQSRSRLVLTTPQGSTKIFKSDDQQPEGQSFRKSCQNLDVRLENGSSVCYLPEPSVPYAKSRYEQVQRFTLLQNAHASDVSSSTTVEGPSSGPLGPSLCILDWVTRGRSARGEDWSFHEWIGRNEVWTQDCRTGKRRLLLRDTVILDDEYFGSNVIRPGKNDSQHREYLSSSPLSVKSRAHPHGVLGTFILHGPLFESLATFFMDEFSSLPRIGGRNWSSHHPDQEINNTKRTDDVVWTAARIRGDFVIVKFGAPEFEAAKDWLGDMIRREGSIEKEFGHEALGCV